MCGKSNATPCAVGAAAPQLLNQIQAGKRGLMDGWFRLAPGGGFLGGGKKKDVFVGEVDMRVQYRAYD